ncbi:hypothetical protein [Oculatella sp. LEGE 06141]|uniref:hypothetical protein n=1 Tax=Oculatella sp. LEGE 06141 TaxID=1828648 RepID=UPI001D15129E|nr:hypothetical protein [Oculatella sp. LEGE 06141]
MHTFDYGTLPAVKQYELLLTQATSILRACNLTGILEVVLKVSNGLHSLPHPPTLADFRANSVRNEDTCDTEQRHLI